MATIPERIELEKSWINSLCNRTRFDEKDLERVGKELAYLYFKRKNLENEVKLLKSKPNVRRR